MPFYDLICKNNHEQLDKLLKLGERPPCPECGEPTETLWRSNTAHVIGDEIPGGIWIRHGLVDKNGNPQKFYSKSEIQKEAKKRGLVNIVEHVPEKGSDKSKHTTKWV